MSVSYADDIEDLLGEPGRPTHDPVTGRPSSRKLNRTSGKLEETMKRRQMESGRAADNVMNGVSVPWLSRVFGIDPVTCRKRLVGCPAKQQRTSGHIYDLAEAAQYLVKPKIDPQEFLKRMKQADLPPQLQEAYWSAVLKRQKVEENAGDLWRTSDVFDLMSDVLKTVREATQLFPTTLERKSNLTPAQQASLTQMLDELQGNIHGDLLRLAANRKTRSILADLEDVPDV